MPQTQIGVLVGSLRKESFNRKMAHVLSALAPKEVALNIIEIGNLSLYNEDLDDAPPETWVQFRDKIRSMNGVLFVTPEYNRSIPGVLKNAIDIGSRPYGQSAWAGKPGAVISVSPGHIGGFGANHHLRQCLVFLNVPCMQQPEAYIGGAGKLFTQKGDVQSESVRQFLRTFMESFASWVALNQRSKAPRSSAA